ncbi:MAG: type II secretion system F family protein [Nanoarchaeota archaeon]|nr:type II secretion system F family protein [Nanoarchaeota archaeon]
MPSDNAKAACSLIINLATNTKPSAPDFENTLTEIEQNLNIVEDSFHLPEDAKEKKKKIKKLSSKKRKEFLKDINIEEGFLKNYMKKKTKTETKALARVDYTLYETTAYGILSNRFFEKTTVSLTKNYPEAFTPLIKALKSSGIKILSKTYISMMLFSSLLVFILITLLTAIFFKLPVLLLQILRGFLLGALGTAVFGLIFYFYPSSMASTRERAIKTDLPFAIINMAGVAGSGGKPISIFKTLLTSDEYPGLRDEIKKIVNYVNLFGYDLSTALRAVARRTPSLRFKDLLDGIVNTIESGGDLKDYLQTMANEALSTYRLERQKAVESVSTYSDIYTTVLIAAPLLFFVTLAIIQTMGGEIGGLSVSTLATVGTYLVIPLLNVGFIIFLSVVQPN